MAAGFGLETDTAADGIEALRRIEQAEAADRPYALVLLDWKMPGIDGIECLRLLAERERTRHPMPLVLMLTAFSRDEVQQRLSELRLQVGATLTKPVTPSTLHDACTSALGHASLRTTRSARREETFADVRSQLDGTHILLVEDNPLNRELALDLLRKAGIAVTVASNGQEALEQLSRARFDGVLMDCQMPVLDGYATTRALRARPELRDLPVIAMTANAMVGDREKVLEAGMNDHIAKPIDFAHMFTTLARWVRRPPPPAAPAAGPAPLPRLPGLDTAAGLDNVVGDEALYRRMLAMFLSREAAFDERFRAAWNAGDVDAATRAAHDLKNEAGTLGMAALSRAAAALELACRERRAPAAVEALARDVSACLAPLIAGLRAAALQPSPAQAR
jgi:CheY-like chemotaxis protein/HPt (histidine-containing phosphotransfer) domain-containing protein